MMNRLASLRPLLLVAAAGLGLFLCGVVLAISHFAVEDVFLGVCGCVLAACGLTLIITGVRARSAVRSAQKH